MVIFIIPHYVAMLSALVIKYGKYVYYERKQVLRGRQNTAVRELRELTKIEKLLDVFSMNMFVYLTLIIGFYGYSIKGNIKSVHFVTKILILQKKQIS